MPTLLTALGIMLPGHASHGVHRFDGGPFLLQSYLWNCAASHRASQFGLDGAVAGDLVLEGDADPADDAGDDADMCDDETGAAVHLASWCQTVFIKVSSSACYQH